MGESMPHGGKLINRIDEHFSKENIRHSVELSKLEVSDLELIANGAYSPLEGFMEKKDYDSVVEKMRLSNGLPWSIPITLAVEPQKAKLLKIGETINLIHDNTIYGVMIVKEMFKPDKKVEADRVYRTIDPHHPGVKKLFERPDIYLAGPITLIKRLEKAKFESFHLDPTQTREKFKELGWETVVGF